jgi:conjugal transfer pilus assembly protein TraL
MKRIHIPRYIDKPSMLLFWSVEEVVVITVMASIGMLIEQVFILLTLSIFATKKYREFNQYHPDGFYIHYLYWQGVVDQDAGKTLPNSSIKEFLE